MSQRLDMPTLSQNLLEQLVNVEKVVEENRRMKDTLEKIVAMTSGAGIKNEQRRMRDSIGAYPSIVIKVNSEAHYGLEGMAYILGTGEEK